MTIQIGRAGAATGSANLTSPASWKYNGDEIQIEGVLYGTVADAFALRQQLRGYINNFDEPAVPVISSADATITGYYRVTAAEVSTQGASLATGSFPYSVTLQRVPGYSNAQFETVVAGATRTNDYGVTASAWIGLPAGATEVSDVGSADKFRLVDPGTDFVARLVPTGGYTADVVYKADPTKAYIGAATILTIPSDATGFTVDPTTGLTIARAVVGRQLPKPAAAGWMLNNGLLRVWPATTGLYVQWFTTLGAWKGDGTTPTNGRLITIDIAGAFFDFTTGQPAILRNSVEEVVLRVPISASRKARGAGTIGYIASADISLKRAARFCSFSFVTNDAGTVTVAGSPNEAATNPGGTGYSQAAANDANGGRLTIGSARTSTLGTTTESSARAAVANTPLEFMFGFRASATDASDGGWNDFLAGVTEKVLVVGR